MYSKSLILIGVIFACIGIPLVIISIFFSFSITNERNQVMENPLPIIAHVSDIVRGRQADDFDRIYISYAINDNQITTRLNFDDGRNYIGRPINIYVNPNNPTHFITNNTIDFLLPILFGIVGLIFSIVGLIFLIGILRKSKLHKWLLANGDLIEATIIGSDFNRSIIINGRPATVLVAEYENMRFISQPINNNKILPTGTKIDILVHPNDKTKYTFIL